MPHSWQHTIVLPWRAGIPCLPHALLHCAGWLPQWHCAEWLPLCWMAAPSVPAPPCRPTPLSPHPDDGDAAKAATAFISSPNKAAAMAALSQLPHVQTELLNQTLTDQQFQASWLHMGAVHCSAQRNASKAQAALLDA